MKLHRETLFEQVWATPVTHLCKTYGLSDQGLRKACVKLQIPMPERGHWAKVAAGHKISRPALPPLRPENDQASLKRKSRRVALSSIGTGLSDAEIKSTPALTMGSFHSAIRHIVQEYTQAEMEAFQIKAKFDWEEANPGRTFRGTAPRFGSWQAFCDNGKILRPTHKKCFMRVSLLTYKRAFRLLQLLIEKLELAGFSVELPNDRERLTATRDSASVSIRLIERQETGQRKEFSSWSKEPRFVRTLSPTGCLVIGIEQQGLGESQFADRFDELLEEQMDGVMTAVEYRHQRSMETLKQWKLQQQRSEEREQARQEDLRLRELVRRSEEAEKSKRQALLQEARDWQAADTLKAYTAHLELRRSSGGQPADGYEAWLAWAVEVAKALDPSDRRVSLGSGRPNTKLEGE